MKMSFDNRVRLLVLIVAAPALGGGLVLGGIQEGKLLIVLGMIGCIVMWLGVRNDPEDHEEA